MNLPVSNQTRAYLRSEQLFYYLSFADSGENGWYIYNQGNQPIGPYKHRANAETILKKMKYQFRANGHRA